MEISGEFCELNACPNPWHYLLQFEGKDHQRGICMRLASPDVPHRKIHSWRLKLRLQGQKSWDNCKPLNASSCRPGKAEEGRLAALSQPRRVTQQWAAGGPAHLITALPVCLVKNPLLQTSSDSLPFGKCPPRWHSSLFSFRECPAQTIRRQHPQGQGHTHMVSPLSHGARCPRRILPGARCAVPTLQSASRSPGGEGVDRGGWVSCIPESVWGSAEPGWGRTTLHPARRSLWFPFGRARPRLASAVLRAGRSAVALSQVPTARLSVHHLRPN